jgi:hypothetical protein
MVRRNMDVFRMAIEKFIGPARGSCNAVTVRASRGARAQARHDQIVGNAARDGRRIFRHDRRGTAFGIFFTPIFYVFPRSLTGHRPLTQRGEVPWGPTLRSHRPPHSMTMRSGYWELAGWA